jgi:hypothetical protein
MSDNANELVRGDVKVEWAELGEGKDGDYDPNDPDDIELLRFDVSREEGDDWEAIDDASYCTQVPVSATPEQRAKGLQLIMDEIYDAASEDHSIKKACEHLSWISLESIETGCIEKIYVL